MTFNLTELFKRLLLIELNPLKDDFKPSWTLLKMILNLADLKFSKGWLLKMIFNSILGNLTEVSAAILLT